MFASTRRLWGWAFGLKVSSAQVFYFCNGKVKTWRIDNIWNYATFNLYIVQAEILYLQRFSTDFRNLCLSSKRLTVVIWWKVSGAQVFYFCNGEVRTLRIDKILNFGTFNLYTVQGENLYLQRYSTDFRNLYLSSQIKICRCWRWPLGGKFQVRTCFSFAMARWKFCASTTSEILLLSTCTLCQQKSNISKDIQPIFEIFPQLEDVDGSHLVESFRCARVLLCTGRWKFGQQQHFKFCHFQPVHCGSRNPISPKVFNRFLKCLPQLEDCECGHLGWKFQARSYFTFAMARWNLAHRQHLKLCYFQPVHCASRNPISPKVFNRFSKSLPQLEEVDGGHSGGKFQVRRYFTFAMARWELCASTKF